MQVHRIILRIRNIIELFFEEWGDSGLLCG